MKKVETMELAPERSKLLCEYITKILSDNEKVNGEIKINFAKINNILSGEWESIKNDIE